VGVGRRFTTQAVWLQGPTLWCHALGVAVRCACLWCKLGVCRGRPHSEGRRCAAIHARSRFLVCVFLIVRGMPLQAVRLAKPWTTPRHAYPNQPVNQSQHMLSGHVRKQQEQPLCLVGWVGNQVQLTMAGNFVHPRPTEVKRQLLPCARLEYSFV